MYNNYVKMLKNVEKGLNMKKRNLVGILIGTMCLLQTMTSFAESGWQQNETGRWFENEDGSYPVNQWEQLEGNWYFANGKGYVETGFFRDGGRLYWLGEDGVMAKDIAMTIEGSIYQIDSEGNCSKLPAQYTGWLKYEKGWWYREQNGSYPINVWKQINGEFYHFNGEGYMDTGWFSENGVNYWLGEDGAMAHDTTLVVNGLNMAFDSQGAAQSSYKAPTVIPPETEKTELQHTVDSMADQVLSQIVNDGMSESQKAAAIYSWVRGNLRYSASGSIGDWTQGAYEGLRKRHGNCYTYYSTSLELLSRAGIPNIEVVRSTDNDHFWNLVYVDGAWYHFDTTPRVSGGDFCLLTTAQIMDYSNKNYNSHVFDQSLYPPTP